MRIDRVLDHAAQRYPDRVALVADDWTLRWGEVHSRVQALATWLRELGVERGDRIAVLEWNSLPFFELTFAVARLGAVLMPVNVRLDAAQVAAILQQGGARTLVAHPDFEALMPPDHRMPPTGAREPGLERVVWTGPTGAQLPGLSTHPWPDLATLVGPAPSSGGDAGSPGSPPAGDTGSASLDEDWANELAQLYFTSGTTGEPKGVMLTHANIGAHAQAAIQELAIDERDVWAHVAPMFHLADAWATIAVTLAGGSHVFVPRFDAGHTARVIDRHGVTLTNLIPTMLAALLQHVRAIGPGGFDGSSLRLLLSGGAPIAPDLVRRVIETFGCEYVQTYGMTETSPYLTLSLLDEALRHEPQEVQLRYRAKTGRAFKGVELRLVDEAGADVPPDGESVGEILARGATVTSGYWNNAAATREAFAGGWLRTGDLATLDERGFFDIVDRKKDIIITGGENVYSTEVENVLHEHPAVLEAAVVGRPDEQWGERVHAVVALVPDSRVSADELLIHCRARLPGFKSPKTLELMDSLPKTGSGKIHKRALR